MDKKTIVRILCAVLVGVMVLSLIPMAVFAASGDTLYFKPSTNWTEANARFSAYFFGDGEAWVSMTDSDGDGVYECTIPGDFASVIFVRMNPDTTENNWNDGVKWNQTADLTIPTDGKNCFEVNAGEWNGAQGTWTIFESDNSCTHNWGTGSVTTAATCEKDGVKTYTCSLCGNTKTEAITALGHNYVDGTCDRCGNVQAASRVIYFVNADNWTTVNAYAWNTDTNEQYLGTWPGSAMTLVEGNLYSITVSGDATHIIFNNGSAQTDDLELSTEYNRYTFNGEWDYYSTCAHSYNNGTVTTAPTCNDEGVKTYTCTLCGHTKTAAIPALGHNYVDGVCSFCGEKEPCNHTWDNGSTTTAATCTTNGVKTYTCRLCGDTKTETINATGHKYLDGVCYVCGAKEPVIEYVDIATAADLVAFANRVNAGETTLNGRLVANIDLKGASWTPIGIYCPGGDTTKSVFYRGIFNGNGYTVSNFTVSGTDCVGLFGYAEMATIMNLGIINATMTGWNAGAVIGYAPTATIINCYAIGCTITGNTTNPIAIESEAVHVGAIAGSNAGTVKNCYAVNCTLSITFEGQFNSMSPLGGVVVGNNYYNNVSGSFTNTKGATSVTTDQLSSGEIAYLLQGVQEQAVWGQEIGKDTYPVIFGKSVSYENGQYVNKEAVDCDHNYVASVTAPTCGTAGYTIYTCSACGAFYKADEVAATGEHTYTYSFVDGYHTLTCSVCGDVQSVAGTNELRFKAINLALGSDISINYKAPVDPCFENVYVVFEVGGEEIAYVYDYTVESSSGRYVFAYQGINPQLMGENVNATLYGTLNGYEVSFNYPEYSVLTYCNSQLSKAATTAETRTLISNLLVYGAKVQLLKNFETDSLLPDRIDPSYSQTPTSFPGTDALVNGQVVANTELKNETHDVASASLVLSNKVSIKFGFKLDDATLYTYKVTINGSEYTYTADNLTYDESNGRYYLEFSEFYANEFDAAITVMVLQDGVQVSRALTYTVNTYIKNNADAGTALAEVLKALYCYGEAAKNV